MDKGIRYSGGLSSILVAVECGQDQLAYLKVTNFAWAFNPRLILAESCCLSSY
jgi:hypothetical protein